MGLRRLPVYLLLDCSGSMEGDPIEAVRMGLKALRADLQGNPQALETVWLSVITFDSSARQVVPLSELIAFQEPPLQAKGLTSLGEALTLLADCIEKEVRTMASGKKGDYRPMVFLMTDGIPTDDWEQPANRLKQRRMANIVACAAGSGADETILKRITEQVVRLTDSTPGAFAASWLG